MSNVSLHKGIYVNYKKAWVFAFDIADCFSQYYVGGLI